MLNLRRGTATGRARWFASGRGKKLWKKRFKKLRRLPVLPTMLTAGNLGCGVTAILCASSGHLGWGAGLVFIAMVCDLLDGKVARMTGTQGPFGAELDSLADVVSFGVAPALLAHRAVLGTTGFGSDDGERLVWAVAVLYPVMAAIRLARYNVEHSDAPTSSFKGLPSPGAAALVCGWIALFSRTGLDSPEGSGKYQEFFLSEWLHFAEAQSYARIVLLGITLVAAVLMVSTIPFPHLGNTMLGKRARFRSLVLMMLCLGLVAYKPVIALVALTTGYVLYGLIPGMIHAIRRWANWQSIMDAEDEEAAPPRRASGEIPAPVPPAPTPPAPPT